MADIKHCFNIEDGQESLSCVKQAVREYKGPCAPKLVLLTQKDCPHCAEERAWQAADIKTGVVTEIDVLSDEGKEIVKLNEIDAVPALLLLDCKNKLIT